MIIQEPSFGHLCARMDDQTTALTMRPITRAIHPAPLPIATSDRADTAVRPAPASRAFAPGNCRRAPLEARTITSASMQSTVTSRPP